MGHHLPGQVSVRTITQHQLCTGARAIRRAAPRRSAGYEICSRAGPLAPTRRVLVVLVQAELLGPLAGRHRPLDQEGLDGRLQELYILHIRPVLDQQTLFCATSAVVGRVPTGFLKQALPSILPADCHSRLTPRRPSQAWTGRTHGRPERPLPTQRWKVKRT
jgi:hypothetical protein